MKFTSRLKGILSAPLWQPLAVLVAVAGLLWTIFLGKLIFGPAAPERNRLIFSSDTSKDLTDFPELVRDRMKFLLDGKEERALHLFILRLEYKGDQPVRSADFERPIRGTIPDNRKLVAVQKSPNLEGPMRFNKETGKVARDEHPSINFEVELLDRHTFEIKPLLINQGEWLGIEIYTAASNDVDYKPPKDSAEKYELLSSEIKWTCRVANCDCPSSHNFPQDFEGYGWDVPAFLDVSIIHQGWSVYFIVLFAVVNLNVFVLLARGTGFQKRSVGSQLALFSAATALSIASGEVAADWLLPYKLFGHVLFGDQPLYAYLLFWLDIALLIVLALWALSKRRKHRRTRPRTHTPTD